MFFFKLSPEMIVSNLSVSTGSEDVARGERFVLVLSQNSHNNFRATANKARPFYNDNNFSVNIKWSSLEEQ